MKSVPLSRGLHAIVDDADYDLVSRMKWYALAIGNTSYAVREGSDKHGDRGKFIYMHRFILGDLDSKKVDHKNGDGLDNRRDNLRLCTHTENMQNTQLRKNNTSGYKGVTWNARKEKWQVSIHVNRKSIFLGYFTDKKLAHAAYKNAAQKHHGEFARIK